MNLPKAVHVHEVGPRGGFQNEPERIENASVVRPDVIPQLSDGVEVLHGIDVPEGVDRTVLIPNSKGLDNALKVRETFEEAAIFVSASETHNRKNVNRAVADTMVDNDVMARHLVSEGARCAAVIATSQAHRLAPQLRG